MLADCHLHLLERRVGGEKENGFFARCLSFPRRILHTRTRSSYDTHLYHSLISSHLLSSLLYEYTKSPAKQTNGSNERTNERGCFTSLYFQDDDDTLQFLRGGICLSECFCLSSFPVEFFSWGDYLKFPSSSVFFVYTTVLTETETGVVVAFDI